MHIERVQSEYLAGDRRESELSLVVSALRVNDADEVDQFSGFSLIKTKYDNTGITNDQGSLSQSLMHLLPLPFAT